MPVTKNCNPATCAKSRATKSKPIESHGKALSVAVKKQDIGKSRTLLEIYKQQLTCLSMTERLVAVGVMLGDASLQTQDGGKSYLEKTAERWNK